jgi:hypothetical protein
VHKKCLNFHTIAFPLMLKSPLLQTLRLLNQEEMENLQFFVNSPLFNEMNRFRDTVALFDYLRPHFPAFDAPDLEKSVAGSVLFPERKNPKAEMEKAMSHLMRVVKQYITFRQFAIQGNKQPMALHPTAQQLDTVHTLNSARQQLALMRFYSERIHQSPDMAEKIKVLDLPDADHFFVNLYERQKKDFESIEAFYDFDDYEFHDFQYFMFLLEQERTLFDSAKQRRDGSHHMLSAMESLDRFYLISKLHLLCHMMHQIRMASPFSRDPEEMNRFLLNHTITRNLCAELEQHHYLQSDIIVFYSKLLKCLSSDDEGQSDQAAEEVYQMLRDTPSFLNSTRVQDFNIILRSYWSRRYRQTRDKKFLNQVFELQLIQMQMLDQHATIPYSQMHNILIIALKLNRTDQAEEILQSFKGRIQGILNDHNPYAEIWWAMVYFAKSDFAEAAKFLPHYYQYGTIDDISFYSVAATLDVKIRYEMNTLDEDQHFNMVRATSKKIKSDKTLPPEARKERERFFPLATRLYKLKTKSRQQRKKFPEEAAAIEAEILLAPVVDQEWLLEKCRELQQWP